MKRILFLSLFLIIGSFVHASENKALLVSVSNGSKLDALREEIARLEKENEHNAIVIKKCIAQLKTMVPVPKQRSDWHAAIMKNPAAKKVYWELRVINALHKENIKQSYRLLKQVTDWNKLLKSGIEK